MLVAHKSVSYPRLSGGLVSAGLRRLRALIAWLRTPAPSLEVWW